MSRLNALARGQALTDDLRHDTAADLGSAVLADALRRTAEGDRLAFEELYRLTSARLFGACLGILHDRGDAEEALQETYLAAWRSAGAFDGERGRPMTWLLTLARNRAVDRLRASAGKTRQAPASADVADPSPSPFAALEAEEQGGDLARCLETLATDDRGFIRTAFFEGLTYAELAARAALPLGTVKSRVRRALLKLRDCLA